MNMKKTIPTTTQIHHRRRRGMPPGANTAVAACGHGGALAAGGSGGGVAARPPPVTIVGEGTGVALPDTRATGGVGRGAGVDGTGGGVRGAVAADGTAEVAPLGGVRGMTRVSWRSMSGGMGAGV